MALANWLGAQYFAWQEITGTTRANELRCYPGLSFGEDLYYPSVGVL